MKPLKEDSTSLRNETRPSTAQRPLPSALAEDIRAAVLAADMAPAILTVIRDACKERSDELLKKDWSTEAAAPKSAKSIDDILREARDPYSDERVEDLWCWWLMFGHQLDYVIRDMEERIRHRSMTRGQIRAEHKAKELEQKRAELARLEAGK